MISTLALVLKIKLWKKQSSRNGDQEDNESLDSRSTEQSRRSESMKRQNAKSVNALLKNPFHKMKQVGSAFCTFLPM